MKRLIIIIVMLLNSLTNSNDCLGQEPVRDDGLRSNNFKVIYAWKVMDDKLKATYLGQDINTMCGQRCPTYTPLFAFSKRFLNEDDAFSWLCDSIDGSHSVILVEVIHRWSRK